MALAAVLLRPRLIRLIMKTDTPSLEQLLAALKGLSDGSLAGSAAPGAGPAKKPPPVEHWNPPFCGDIGLAILRDGAWRHEGTRITRESLVRLFASVLRKDADGETYVVTPVEKIRVRVEDAPFLAVRVDWAGEGAEQVLVFTTNVGDVVQAGPENPIRVAFDAAGAPRPYVLVRGRLEARILRAPFFEMAEWTLEQHGRAGVWSGGAFFALDAA